MKVICTRYMLYVIWKKPSMEFLAMCTNLKKKTATFLRSLFRNGNLLKDATMSNLHVCTWNSNINTSKICQNMMDVLCGPEQTSIFQLPKKQFTNYVPTTLFLILTILLFCWGLRTTYTCYLMNWKRTVYFGSHCTSEGNIMHSCS